MPQADFISDLIQRIHNAPTKAVIATTGGGASAISALLNVAGASRTVLEGLVPYSPASLEAFLGAIPGQACSETMARAMAVAAYLRGQQYAAHADPEESGAIIGLAATCSLASNREKRGDHRVHVAYQSAKQTTSWSLDLQKNARSRVEEENLTCRLIVNLLADAAGLSERLPLGLKADERVIESGYLAPAAWQDLLAGRRLIVPPVRGVADQSIRAVFPGAFNPLHDGHREMKRMAEKLLGEQVFYELSIKNVDKLPLDYIQIHHREQQLGQALILAMAPTFVEKARLLPGVTFVVGIDTLKRIGDVKYYAGEKRRDEAIEAIAAQGCRFLVFGRSMSGNFATLAGENISEQLRQISTEVPESEFRVDVSSTGIRR